MQDVHEKIADRAPSYTAWLLFFGRMKPAGFVFNSGPKFKEMRRFTLKTLRAFGLQQPLVWAGEGIRFKCGITTKQQ